MKSFTKFLVLMAALVVAIAFVAGCGKNPVGPDTHEPNSVSTSDSVTYLNFVNPMTMSEVGQYVRQNRLEILEVRLQRPGYVAGFKLEGQTPEQAAETFAMEHRKFLMMLSSRTESEMANERAAAVSELSRLSSSSLRVSMMTVSGTPNRFRQLPNVKVMATPLSTSNPGPVVNPISVKTQVQPNSLYHQSWAPYGGTSEVNKSYSYQRFIFNNVNAILASDATYEHEVHIWDKGYVNRTGYWVTNLPNAYLDCGNQTDSVDNFAVGTFTANQIRPYVWYYTYMGFYGQSASTSTVSVYAQRGQRYAWNCWYVWSRETAGPLTRQLAPSGISWQF